jgi:penicillin V acylase-like amidase (Ntn superfamily)
MYWYSYNPKIKLNDIDKIKISNEINDKNLIIKNLFLNNYDFDRSQYFEKNNIKVDKYLNEILENNNFEFSVY